MVQQQESFCNDVLEMNTAEVWFKTVPIVKDLATALSILRNPWKNLEDKTSMIAVLLDKSELPSRLIELCDADREYVLMVSYRTDVDGDSRDMDAADTLSRIAKVIDFLADYHQEKRIAAYIGLAELGNKLVNLNSLLQFKTAVMDTLPQVGIPYVLGVMKNRTDTRSQIEVYGLLSLGMKFMRNLPIKDLLDFEPRAALNYLLHESPIGIPDK